MKYLSACIWLISGVFVASSSSPNDELQEDSFAVSSHNSAYPNQSEIQDMGGLSKGVPENLTDLSILNKNATLPEYLAHGPVDYAFLNRFSPAELEDEYFWMTVVHVCHAGLDLNSCGPSARHAALKFIELQTESPDSRDRMMLKKNLDKIFSLLIKTESYYLIGRLLMIHEVRLATSIVDMFKTHKNLFRNVVLSIENVPERKSLITVISSDVNWCIYGIEQAMNLYSEMLADLLFDGKSNPYVLRCIILIYDENHDAEANNLIYNYKNNLLSSSDQPHLAKINSYLHQNTVMFAEGEQLSSDVLYEFRLAAIAKRDAETLIQLLNIARTNIPYLDSPTLRGRIPEKIINDPELFRRLLPFLHQTSLGAQVINSTDDLFEKGLPKDEKLQAILQIVMEFYAENPGIHFNLIIFPEILNKDLDSFLNYLKENPHVVDSFLANVINTLLLIEQEPKKIVNFLDKLVNNFPSIDLSKIMPIIMKKVSFQCIYELLQKPEYAENASKCSVRELDWDFSDIRRIFQNDLEFKAFYPLRQTIWNAKFESFDIKTLPITFVTHSEMKSFLNFFDSFYAMPESRNYDGSFDEFLKTDYNLLLSLFENDYSLGLQVMNYTLLVPFILKHRREVELILKQWFYDYKSYPKLKRVVELIRKNAEIDEPIIIEIDSLDMFKFQAFYLFQHHKYRGINLKFNLEAILNEFSRLPESRVDEIMRNVAACRFLYDLMVGPSKRVVDQFEELKRRNRFFFGNY